MKKLDESNWDGAIFAAAGLERINLRPGHAIELDWMLPAPAQGAIMVVCRDTDNNCIDALAKLNDEHTAICTKVERDFLRELLGGCSTPISGLAKIHNDELYFVGNILSTDGKQKAAIDGSVNKKNAHAFGKQMAEAILKNGGKEIAAAINNAK